MSRHAWKAAAVVGMDRTLLADRRGLLPVAGSLAGAAMASGAWWARIIQAARKMGAANGRP